jgi:glycosyltransferase involved in cell wall biosynthesis
LLHVPHFNVPYFYTGAFVVTIHDLLWHTQRGLQVTTLNPAVYWLKYFFYTRIVANAVAKAKQILVPSQTIAAELSTTYPNTKQKTVVTYEGVGDSLLKVSLPKLARKKNTLLYVGSLYPHKNIFLVLQLLQMHPELRLEIVTARSAFVARIKKQVTALELDEQVSFFLSIDDKTLAKHYRQATALIQPSFSEGFGLTGLEALLQQTPLLASDIPIFHEIYQKHATFFDPKSVISLETAWKSLQNNKQQTTLPQNFSKRYNWDTLAKQTLDVYRNAIA